MSTLLAFWLLLSCVHVPDHLQLQPTAHTEPVPVHVVDLSSALAASLGNDPLARHRTSISSHTLEALPDTASLLQVQRVLDTRAGAAIEPALLHHLEQQVSNTAAVGWVRGERLAQIEAQVQSDRSSIGSRKILHWMAPLTESSAADSLSMPPLQWLVGTRDPRAPLQAWGDRHVLLGWLTPNTPLQPIATGLHSAPFDAVRASPAGRLLIGAAAYTDGPRNADVLHKLTLATELVALDAAANGPKARERWRERRDQVGSDIGSDRPEQELLRQVIDLAATSGHPQDIGLGLIALQGLRWLDACDWQPCGGLDRSTELTRASAYGVEAERLSLVWQAIMLEQARDGIKAARDTARFAAALAALTDVLLATAPQPPDESLLRRRSQGAPVWLSIARSLEHDGITSWAELQPVLDAHLGAVTEIALEKNEEKRLADPLRRIRARSLP